MTSYLQTAAHTVTAVQLSDYVVEFKTVIVFVDKFG